MIEKYEITWAAGLLDGEGCFTLAHPGSYRYPRIVCKMTDREPLDKLHKLFGGAVYPIKRPNPTWKDLWGWDVTGARAVGIMLTLWRFLCPRRQKKIKEIVLEWRAKVPYRTEKCRKGHEFTPDNTTYTYKLKNGRRYKYRLCRTCLSLRGDSRANKKPYDELLGGPAPAQDL